MKVFTTILFLSLLMPFTVAASDIVVIVNHENKTEQLSHKALVDIFMGKKTTFPAGNVAITLDHLPNSPARADFYQKLVGKSVAQVNAYWARLLFTGRATPPRVVDDSKAVIQLVRENRDAIGYVDSKDLDSSVRVIASVE